MGTGQRPRIRASPRPAARLDPAHAMDGTGDQGFCDAGADTIERGWKSFLLPREGGNAYPVAVASKLQSALLFWSGNEDPETAKRGWVRSLALLFKNVALKNRRAHRSVATRTCPRHLCGRIAAGWCPHHRSS